MNLDALKTALDAADPDARLIFETADGPIGAGYHVTEFKRLDTAAINCGGQTSAGTEAAMQLLDGAHGDFISAGKFGRILGTTLASVSGIGDAPLSVEFAPANAGLRLYRIAAVDQRDGDVIARLDDRRAVCRPAVTPGTGCYEKKGCCS